MNLFLFNHHRDDVVYVYGVLVYVVCGGGHRNHHIHNAQGGSLRDDGDVLFHAQHDVFSLLYARSIGYPLHHHCASDPA